MRLTWGTIVNNAVLVPEPPRSMAPIRFVKLNFDDEEQRCPDCNFVTFYNRALVVWRKAHKYQLWRSNSFATSERSPGFLVNRSAQLFLRLNIYAVVTARCSTTVASNSAASFRLTAWYPALSDERKIRPWCLLGHNNTCSEELNIRPSSTPPGLVLCTAHSKFSTLFNIPSSIKPHTEFILQSTEVYSTCHTLDRLPSDKTSEDQADHLVAFIVSHNYVTAKIQDCHMIWRGQSGKIFHNTPEHDVTLDALAPTDKIQLLLSLNRLDFSKKQPRRVRIHLRFVLRQSQVT